MNSILNKIAELEELRIQKVSRLIGGDINQVSFLETLDESYVLKLQEASKLPGVFEAEAKGLALLRKTKTFTIPEVVGIGEVSGQAYILMSYLKAKPKVSEFWEQFGKLLALMHKNTTSQFGLDYDNYIGRLPQQNAYCNTASAFYISQRLEPQHKLSKDLGYEIPSLSSFYKNIESEIPKEAPSLIHGDLWNGNYLTDQHGLPALIDPAVSYASREMDLAMMQLFGGFPEKVFLVYDSHFQLQEEWEQRIPLWQLYYLWVHLNTFGRGYQESVFRIIKRYS